MRKPNDVDIGNSKKKKRVLLLKISVSATSKKKVGIFKSYQNEYF